MGGKKSVQWSDGVIDKVCRWRLAELVLGFFSSVGRKIYPLVIVLSRGRSEPEARIQRREENEKQGHNWEQNSHENMVPFTQNLVNYERRMRRLRASRQYNCSDKCVATRK